MKFTNISLVLALVISGSSTAYAADKHKKDNKNKKNKTLTELLKNKVVAKGLLTFYQDKKTGENLMLLNNNQLNTPILYFAHTVDGVTDAGHFRGAYRETKIIEFRRYFNRIDIISKTARHKI